MESTLIDTAITDSGASGWYFRTGAPVTNVDRTAAKIRVGTATGQAHRQRLLCRGLVRGCPDIACRFIPPYYCHVSGCMDFHRAPPLPRLRLQWLHHHPMPLPRSSPHPDWQPVPSTAVSCCVSHAWWSRQRCQAAPPHRQQLAPWTRLPYNSVATARP